MGLTHAAMTCHRATLGNYYSSVFIPVLSKTLSFFLGLYTDGRIHNDLQHKWRRLSAILEAWATNGGQPPPIMGSQRELAVRTYTCTSMHQISSLGPPLLPMLHPLPNLLLPHFNLLGNHILMLTCNLIITLGLPYSFVCSWHKEPANLQNNRVSSSSRNPTPL